MSKIEKIENEKNILKLVMLKSCKKFHLNCKIHSHLLSNPRGGFLALEAENNLKHKKFQIWKKVLSRKIAKICDIKKVEK